jgi:hypothetical protein
MTGRIPSKIVQGEYPSKWYEVFDSLRLDILSVDLDTRTSNYSQKTIGA